VAGGSLQYESRDSNCRRVFALFFRSYFPRVDSRARENIFRLAPEQSESAQSETRAMSTVIASTSGRPTRRVSRALGARATRVPSAFFSLRARPRGLSRGRASTFCECFARGGRADDEPSDPNLLSPAERAAMRDEWSLECRQVGLVHLADCFAKPSAENPADTGAKSVSTKSPGDDGEAQTKPAEDGETGKTLESSIQDIEPTDCEREK